MLLDRRKFLTAALWVAAAPIIVKAANIMPVRAPKLVVAPSLRMRVLAVAPNPINGMVNIYGLDHMGQPVVDRMPFTEFLNRPPIKGFENASRIVGMGRPFGGSTVDDVLVGREITKDPHTGKLIIT